MITGPVASTVMLNSGVVRGSGRVEGDRSFQLSLVVHANLFMQTKFIPAACIFRAF